MIDRGGQWWEGEGCEDRRGGRQRESGCMAVKWVRGLVGAERVGWVARRMGGRLGVASRLEGGGRL